MSIPNGDDKDVIFISYRRSDSDALAGHLQERLSVALAGWSVFLDVRSIDAGEDFKNRIDNNLAIATVLLVLIGKRWIEGDKNRLREPGDLVHHEIQTSLGRGIRILPVLINGADMPRPGDLPDTITELASRNAVELRHARFEDDFRNLVKAIDPEAALTQGSLVRQLVPLVMGIALGSLLGCAVALAGLIAFHSITGQSVSDLLGHDGADLVFPLAAVVGALAGLRVTMGKVRRVQSRADH